MDPTLEKILNPGRVVEFKSLSEEQRKQLGIKATVFRIGVRHFERFGKELAGAIQLLAGVSINMAEEKTPGMQYMAYMIPYTMLNLMPLVGETIRVEPADRMKWEEFPHFLVPEVLEAWIDENFGSKDKWVPWTAVAEKMLNGLTGKTHEISATLSKILSKQATPSETSSTAKQESTPTPAGA